MLTVILWIIGLAIALFVVSHFSAVILLLFLGAVVFFGINQCATMKMPVGSTTSITSSANKSNDTNYSTEKKIEDDEVVSRIESISERQYAGGKYLGEKVKSISFLKCTDVGEQAFYRSPNVVSISLPLCTSVGKSAFAECGALTKVFLPECEKIGESAFYGCANLKEVSLSKCINIEKSTFVGCKNLKEISLENCVSVGESAFADCKNLTSISLPNCTYVAENAFQGCENLVSVKLADGAQISDNAFAGCDKFVKNKNATSDVVKKSDNEQSEDKISLFGEIIQSGWSHMIENPWSFALKALLSIYFLLYIVSAKFRLFMFCLPHLIKVTRDGKIYSKTCKSLTGFSLIRGNKVLKSMSLSVCNEIGNRYFQNCIGLTAVFLPSCERIGKEAFSGCLNLETLEIPNCKTLESQALSGCSKLVVLKLPKCAQLDVSALVGCENLTTLYLSDCSRECLEQLVEQCPKLINVMLLDKVKVERTEFEYCSAVKNLYLPKCEEIANQAFKNCQVMTHIDIPKCVTVGIEAFSGCVNLCQIDLPSCIEMASFAFYGCNNLLDVSAPVCQKMWNTTFSGCPEQMRVVREQWKIYAGDWETINAENSRKIADSFEAYPSLDTIELPNCVRLCDGAFKGIDNLRNAVLPVCTCVAEEGFADCIALESIEIPKCQNLGVKAFAMCQNLKTMSLLQCSEVGSQAFSACKGLKNVEVPCCESIGDAAFNGCVNLLRMEIPQCKYIGISAFEGCINLADFFGQCFVNIGASAFKDCCVLTKISLPVCENIGVSAFEGCVRMKEFYAPCCEVVKESTFMDCYALKEISLPACKRIETAAFDGCEYLTTVSLPICEKVAEGAFAGCDNLTHIDAPKCDKKWFVSAAVSVDEIPVYRVERKVAELQRAPTRLCIVNAGKMNHGKSSVLNSLLDREDAFKAADVRTTVETSESELGEGIFLRDTPGLRADHKDDAVAYSAYKKANMILFVHTPNVGELHADELEAINKIKELFPSKEYFRKHFCLVLTFVDSVDEDSLRKIKEKIVEELDRICDVKDIPIFSVSNSRYWKGKKENKQVLLKRSGINELRDFLLSRVDTWKVEMQSLKRERIQDLVDGKLTAVLREIDMIVPQVDELKHNHEEKQAQLFEIGDGYIADLKKRSQKYGARSNMTKRVYESSIDWLRGEGLQETAEKLEAMDYTQDLSQYERILRDSISAFDKVENSLLYQKLQQLQSDVVCLENLKLSNE